MLRIHSFANNERKQKTKDPVFTQGKQVNNQDSREKKKHLPNNKHIN